MRDLATVVSNNQSLVGSASAVSTSSIRISNGAVGPLSVAGRDVGRGADLFFRVFINQAFDGGVASLRIDVIEASDEALTSGVVVLGGATFTLSGLAQGNELDVHIPSLSENLVVAGQFLGLKYTPSAVPATGAVTAFVPFGDSPSTERRLLRNYKGPGE